MDEHTPTPWTFDHDWHRLPTIFGADKYKLAIIEKDRLEQAKANAALIINAVNNHDMLLRTLQHIAAMRALPDDRANRITLVAAIEMARTTLSAVKAISNVVGGAPK